jgi:hypothetical protein
VGNDSKNVVDDNAIVEYICNTCPSQIHMKNDEGDTPLNYALRTESNLRTDTVKVLCNTDESVVRVKCSPSDIGNSLSQQLPLHLLIEYRSPRSEISDEGDCLRLFLRLYPASAGIKDGHLKTPYDLAVSKGLSTYFIRMLLAADPTIDPVKRRNLSYTARREGMFLAFTALSSTIGPIVWAKLRHEVKNLLKRVISYL